MTCDEIFDDVLKHGGGYNLFSLAGCFIDGYDPEKLHLMLTSQDLQIVSDGLFVLSEIGELAKSYVADIERLTLSSEDDIRQQALELMSRFWGSTPSEL